MSASSRSTCGRGHSTTSACPAAAERLAATFSARTGLPVEVDLDGRQRLPAEIELPLFRVLQEALQSVTERSDATQVRVTMTSTPTGTVFEVADDGSVAERRSSRGTLARIGARAAAARRRAPHGLDVAGAGTVVRAVVPEA